MKHQLYAITIMVIMISLAVPVFLSAPALAAGVTVKQAEASCKTNDPNNLCVKAEVACNTTDKNSQCYFGYVNSDKGSTVCDPLGPGTQPWTDCINGVNLGRAAANNNPTPPTVPVTNPPSNGPSTAAQAYCNGKNDTGIVLTACETGYDQASNSGACDQYTDAAKTACQNAQKDAGSGGGTTNNPQPDPETSCETSSAAALLTLGWIACPILEGVDSFVNTVNSVITDQLNFNTSTYLTANVHRSWTIIKDIATSLLVIIMLIMVISQAITGGAA